MTDITTRERPTYGPGSRQSFFRDLCTTSGYFGRDAYETQEARTRLKAYADRSERTGLQESRAGMGTQAAAGGAFVTPEYLVSDFALFLSPLSSFAAQCTQVPDEGYGMTMYIPGFTALIPAGQQAAELQGIPGGTGAAAYQSAPLVTIVGRQPVSQQLIDRAGPVALDQLVWKQIGDELRANVDKYVVAQAIANGTNVAGAAAPWTAAKLWGDIQLAGEQMEDANGAEVMPTHFFAVPKQIQWLMSQVDTQGRPIMTPTPSGAWLPDNKDANGDPAAGATGYNILGLSVYEDGNIAASGANAQLLVAKPSEFFVQVSDPYFRVVVGEVNQASTLTVDIQGYCYVGIIARRSSACQSITGTAYPSVVVFA